MKKVLLLSLTVMSFTNSCNAMLKSGLKVTTSAAVSQSEVSGLDNVVDVAVGKAEALKIVADKAMDVAAGNVPNEFSGIGKASDSENISKMELNVLNESKNEGTKAVAVSNKDSGSENVSKMKVKVYDESKDERTKAVANEMARDMPLDFLANMLPGGAIMVEGIKHFKKNKCKSISTHMKTAANRAHQTKI